MTSFCSVSSIAFAHVLFQLVSRVATLLLHHASSYCLSVLESMSCGDAYLSVHA